MVSTSIQPDVSAQRDALVERLLAATLGVWDTMAAYIGVRLGLYQHLVEIGPATSSQLATAAGLSERYVREWLEQQAVTGFVAVENPDAEAGDRRYSLPPGHAEVLTERDNLNYMAPLPLITVGSITPLQQVIEAFRTGGGVPYAEFGPDLHEGQAGMNRNLFLYQLGPDYLAAIPDLHARLSSEQPSKIADFGCGYGYSSIGMASFYPNARVDGFDLDEASVEAAQQHIRDHGLTDRVRVQLRDAGDPTLAGQYDLVTAFECIHDMADPVSALRTMRRLARDDGTVLVVDERARESFSPDAGDVERMLYGYSFLHCLPVGMADQPSVGTGTVMRPRTFKGYALDAGFRDVEVLPLENLFFNFYRLHM